MATLFDKIKYDHKHYNELLDITGKQEIANIVEKLKPLEDEIINDPNGSITIMKSGNIFSDSFADELGKRITDILCGK